jgi:uncharacterized membrane protein YkoI
MTLKKVVLGVMLAVLSVGLSALAVDKDTAEDRDTAKAAAGKIKGSIKVEGEHTDAELAKMANITKSDAEKIVLKDIKAKDTEKKVTASELEVEEGYLVYSIEVKVIGKDGVDEFLVDAGNGKILTRDHESEGDEENEGNEGGEGNEGSEGDEGGEGEL